METIVRKRLHEVDIMRLVVIVLLIADHAFVQYWGGWKMVFEDVDIPAYTWFGKAVYAIMLETFVFISGYLFGNQVDKTGGGKLLPLIKNKARRLMLPSVIFSIAYLFCFGDPLHSSISKIARSLIYGTGHMWFLPMLFACFIYTWIIHRLRLKPIIALLLILLSSIIFTSAQASLEYSGYYLFFFYLGFSIKVYKFNPMPYARLRYIFLLAVISVVCFVAVNALNIKEMMPEEVTHSLKVCLLYINARLALPFTYSLPGTLAFYLFCLRLLYVKHIAVSPCITKLAGMCFGVYLFQEFIIKGIYYYSPIPQWVGPYALPWVCCMLALPLSMLCTQALLSTRLGRRLIG